MPLIFRSISFWSFCRTDPVLSACMRTTHIWKSSVMAVCIRCAIVAFASVEVDFAIRSRSLSPPSLSLFQFFLLSYFWQYSCSCSFVPNILYGTQNFIRPKNVPFHLSLLLSSSSSTLLYGMNSFMRAFEVNVWCLTFCSILVIVIRINVGWLVDTGCYLVCWLFQLSSNMKIWTEPGRYKKKKPSPIHTRGKWLWIEFSFSMYVSCMSFITTFFSLSVFTFFRFGLVTLGFLFGSAALMFDGNFFLFLASVEKRAPSVCSCLN